MLIFFPREIWKSILARPPSRAPLPVPVDDFPIFPNSTNLLLTCTDVYRSTKMMAADGRMSYVWAVLNKQFTCCYTRCSCSWSGRCWCQTWNARRRTGCWCCWVLPFKKKNTAQLWFFHRPVKIWRVLRHFKTLTKTFLEGRWNLMVRIWLFLFF